jgi:hypothetical protein
MRKILAIITALLMGGISLALIYGSHTVEATRTLN